MYRSLQVLPICLTLCPQHTCQACEEVPDILEHLNWKAMGFHSWEHHPAPRAAKTILRVHGFLCYTEQIIDKQVSAVL